MIFGAHVILYSKDAAADRAFCRDTLGFASVDAGHGWLIFALPPAEMAVHPADEGERQRCGLSGGERDYRARRTIVKNNIKNSRYSKVRAHGPPCILAPPL